MDRRVGAAATLSESDPGLDLAPVRPRRRTLSGSRPRRPILRRERMTWMLSNFAVAGESAPDVRKSKAVTLGPQLGQRSPGVRCLALETLQQSFGEPRRQIITALLGCQALDKPLP
jgi:hypothetical protein